MHTLLSRNQSKGCSRLMEENENHIVDFIIAELTAMVKSANPAKVQILGKATAQKELETLIPIVFKRNEKLILSQ